MSVKAESVISHVTSEQDINGIQDKGDDEEGDQLQEEGQADDLSEEEYMSPVCIHHTITMIWKNIHILAIDM